jgi:UDP-N-acetylmuramyl pentapeptide synthase
LNWNQVVTLNWNWVVNITGICSKTTTDYFDYAILISNSKANNPIEEINK